MGISNIIVLLGGLGLFLFGMRYMSDGLNQVAGNQLKTMLEKLTRNRFKGFLLGVVVTAIIQSSSATTVMLMGFLNAGIMDLAQATGVIIGANIGTTITAVLIALDVSAIAPICIFIGSAIALFAKKQTKQYIGQIILGFGILFQGLKTMSSDDAMGALKTSEAFQNFITSADNPVVGILIGIAICSILQSSSASIGVLQVLALQGLMPMDFAIYLIIGVNVGSAMPLFLSSISAKTSAKRAAFIYFMFDFVGMILFTPIALFTPFASMIEGITANGSAQIAIGHIIFKVVTAVVLLPFVGTLVKLSEKVLRSKEHETRKRFKYIDQNLDANAITTLAQTGREVERMSHIVRENFSLACDGLINEDASNSQKIRENEEIIDWLNHNIEDFLIKITSSNLSGSTSAHLGKLFHVITDLERIGDHAINILERTELLVENKSSFTEDGKDEIKQIVEKDLELYDRSLKCFSLRRLPDDEEVIIYELENDVDKLTRKAQDLHVERLRSRVCHTSTGVIFTKTLQDLERVGDHCYNIAWTARRDNEFIRQIK